MLKFKVFQGRKDGWFGRKNSLKAVERAAEEATKWMNEQDASVVIRHVTTVAQGEFSVAHVVIWYEDTPVRSQGAAQQADPAVDASHRRGPA